MHSKQALAVLALAASTATPVLSAPLPENQEQARAELEARLSIGPLLKTIGINAGLGAIPAVIDKVTGGDDTAARELAAREELEARLSIGPLLKTIGINAGLGAIPAVIDKVTGGGDNAARELAAREELEARLSIGPILKTIGINAGLGAIPAIIDKVTGGDQNAARELAAELDARGLGSLVGSAVKALENNDSLGKVIGGSLIGGVASGAASSVTQDVLGGNNRRGPEPLGLDLGIDGLSDFKNVGGPGQLGGPGKLIASGSVTTPDILGNNRREPEPLDIGGLGKLLGNGLLGGVASGVGAVVSQDILGNNRREPEPLNIGSIGKGLVGLVASLGGSEIASSVLGTGDNSQRDLTPEETLAALSLISKRSPEPLNIAGIGKGLAGIVAGLAGSQIASSVLGGSDNSQRDLTPEETLAALSLMSKRQIPLSQQTPSGIFRPHFDDNRLFAQPNNTLDQLD